MSYILNKIKGSTEDAIELEKDCRKLQKEIDDKLEVIKEIRDFILIHKGTCNVKEIKDPDLEKYITTIFRGGGQAPSKPKQRTSKEQLCVMNVGRAEYYKEFRRRQAIDKSNGLTLTWPEYRQNRKDEKLKLA